MEPGHFAAVSWIPSNDSQQLFPHTLTIYDAGNIQGFLLKESTGKTTWVVFQIDYRLLQEDGIIVEGRTILSENQTPLHYMSIDTYPMQLQSRGKLQKLLIVPQAQILLSLSEEPLFPSEAPLSSLPVPLLPRQQSLPSHESRAKHGGPVSRVPQKSDSSKLTGGQRSTQNKSIMSPMSKASLSSNQGHLVQPLSQAPTIQEAHPQPSPLEHQTGHESSESPPWTTLAQQSLYSRPPPELEEEHVERA